MKRIKPWLKLAAFLAGALWPAACVKETPETIRQNLEVIARGDLAYIVQEIRVLDSTELVPQPSYKVVEYKVLPQSDIYSVKAVVEYYYFKDIKIKQVRKYRYQFRARQWERYDKTLVNTY
jgi:hypothetical protein